MTRMNKSIAFSTGNVFTFPFTNNGSNQFFAYAGEKLCARFRARSSRGLIGGWRRALSVVFKVLKHTPCTTFFFTTGDSNSACI